MHKSLYSRCVYVLAVCCWMGLSATSLRAQDDDDSVFVPPAWSHNVIKRAADGDLNGALRLLDQLAPSHKNSYVVPFLRAKVWDEKAADASGNAQVAALRQEHRFLQQAKALATGPQNAAIRAEIDADLRRTISFLEEAGASVSVEKTSPRATRSAPIKRNTASPRPVASRPKVVAKAPTQQSLKQQIVVKKLSPLKPRRGYVIGRAIFADGRPVPNFDVQLLGFDGQVNIFPGSTPTWVEELPKTVITRFARWIVSATKSPSMPS